MQDFVTHFRSSPSHSGETTSTQPDKKEPEALTLDHSQQQRRRKTSEMLSEIECRVCYQPYNAARRCPRELHCKHSFCESCLRAMSRPVPPGAERSIDCPLCRHTTTLTAEGNIKTELRVDESALERLVTAGVLDREEDPDDEEEGGERPGTEAEDRESSAGLRGGRLRRSWTKVWRKMSGKSARRRPDDCLTSDDLRSLAMMSCYMF